MLILIIIILIIIIAAVACAILFGVFKIEKVELEDNGTDLKLPLDDSAGEVDEDEKPLFDLDDGLTLKERLDQNGYLGDEREQDDNDETVENAEPLENSDGGAKTEENFYGYDHLCEVKTGRGYLIDCQKTLNAAKESDAVYAAVWIDFDRFRFLNNLRGQAIGDYLICRIGQEFQAVFPEGSIITRISADHFAIIFPLEDAALFNPIDERLRGICEKLQHDMAFKSNLRLCIGIAMTNSKIDYEVSVLLHKANIARHCIKVSRSENWKMFESSMISTWLYGESAVEDYNENQFDSDFTIYYSPQLDLNLRCVIGCEAIVRWKCEDDVSKGLPSSIDKNKLPTNTRKVIYQVCKAMSRWRKAGKQTQTVGVSIPATQFYLDDFDAFLVRCLSEFQIEPPMLAIVIDAPLMRLDTAASARQLKKLRDIGVQTGVDEIDIGYIDLEFLRSMPVSFIKLHRSFTFDIHRNNERSETVKKLFNDTRGMKIRVIFEGVDVQAQADTLRGIGANEIQGHYCGRPQKSEEFLLSLPEYVEKKATSSETVILDDATLNKGDYSLF